MESKYSAVEKLGLMLGQHVRGARVLVSGHSGFKGTWLVNLLNILGAEVYGFSLRNEPNALFQRFNNVDPGRFIYSDINDYDAVYSFIAEIKPEIIFHLAAQPLVLESYIQPRMTFQTNVMGTVNILEAVRMVGSAKAVIVITTDKVYKNVESLEGYLEDSPLGGSDPYSASKSAAEMVVIAWSNLIWGQNFPPPRICTARAGNVIGGGDNSENRLLPDLIRSFKANRAPVLRNPQSVRPWQHVLEPLVGYVLLAEKMLEGKASYDSYNFGPNISAKITVQDVADIAREEWGSELNFETKIEKDRPHESGLLWLDSSRAFSNLSWRSQLTAREAIQRTILWEKTSEKIGVELATANQIYDYLGEFY